MSDELTDRFNTRTKYEETHPEYEANVKELARLYVLDGSTRQELIDALDNPPG